MNITRKIRAAIGFDVAKAPTDLPIDGHWVKGSTSKRIGLPPPRGARRSLSRAVSLKRAS
ncbi:MAG TPA: hypothetical protein VG986_10470 [Pseudolabrys sp.]|nr:hypothetical protein [Pseudolabrys sp.]